MAVPSSRPSARGPALLLLLGGLLGTLASAALTHDRIRTLADPSFTPGCSINSVLNCGDVMDTWQSNLLGFPDMLLGVGAFAALAALGLALLAGAEFPRWLWLGIWAGVAAGFAFTVWLISQCLYAIGALCPWCLLVWAVMIPLFWYVTRQVARPRSWVRRVPHWLVPLGMYTVVAALVWAEFGDRLR
ncbi:MULTISPECIES: vitamin K epoxide reductase family protein [unclassified Streptomyces]|uniref:vitamin K epoxide reductase family protein n=1 Tax=unclassified Streptomyces TaxID=2593676 RepID=UPI003800DA4A